MNSKWNDNIADLISFLGSFSSRYTYYVNQSGLFFRSVEYWLHIYQYIMHVQISYLFTINLNIAACINGDLMLPRSCPVSVSFAASAWFPIRIFCSV